MLYLSYPKLTRRAMAQTCNVTKYAKPHFWTVWEADDKAVADCTDAKATVGEGQCHVLIVLALRTHAPVVCELSVPTIAPVDSPVLRPNAAVMTGPGDCVFPCQESTAVPHRDNSSPWPYPEPLPPTTSVLRSRSLEVVSSGTMTMGGDVKESIAEDVAVLQMLEDCLGSYE